MEQRPNRKSGMEYRPNHIKVGWDIEVNLQTWNEIDTKTQIHRYSLL